jgi:hypothetical protein
MKPTYFVFAFGLTLFFISSCYLPDRQPECLAEVIIQNNSNTSIFAWHCADDCPFTSKTIYSDKVSSKKTHTIESGESKNLSCVTKKTVTVIDSLVIYLLLIDDLKTIEWDTIVAKKMYTKHVYLIPDIVGPELVVTYP